MIKILLVDDDKDLCKIVSDILKKEGRFVRIAYDGESAINKLKSEKFGLMILDYKLSGKNGLQVFEESKQLSPSLPTIMISAYGNTEVRARAKSLGIYTFLDKPFNIKRLVKIVNRKILKHKDNMQ